MIKPPARFPARTWVIFFNDSDVFKVIEGAAYALNLHPDPELEAYLDDLISRISAAQEDDGYLYTARTIDPEAVSKEKEGLTRWSNLRVNHELYNVGHLFEAAVAHYQATGERSLLDVALKNADSGRQRFRTRQKAGRAGTPGDRDWARQTLSGHRGGEVFAARQVLPRRAGSG